jgi:lysophospholipase L1-like esterase
MAVMLVRRQFLAGAALAAIPFPLRAAVVRPLRVAATNQRIPSAFLAVKAGALGFKYRTLHIIGAPTTEIVLGFCGWAIPSNIEIDAPASHHYDKVALEFGGVSVPVTFGGARGVTIVGGVPYILSDPVAAAAFGLANFPRDAEMFVRALGSVAAAGRSLPAGTIAAGFGMRMVSFPAGSAIDDIDGTGAISAPPGAAGRTVAPGPCLVLGRFPPGYQAVICTGDSIADGAGDNSRLVVGKGFFNRAALDANGLAAIGSLNLTKFGSTAGTTTRGLGVPGAPGFRYRQAMLGFGNVLVDQYGTNTLGAVAKTPASAVIDTSRQLWTLARGAGIQKIVRTTLLPRTRSSNRFIDAAGQVPAVNWRDGESRDTVNAAFVAARAAGEIDAIADLLPVVADPGDSHRWRSNGTPVYSTTDGVHPSAVNARAMGAVLRAAYAGLIVT